MCLFIAGEGSEPKPWAHAQRYVWVQSHLCLPLGTWKHPRTRTTGPNTGHKHRLFTNLANKKLSDSSKKFRFASKPCEDVRYILSIQSEITLILALMVMSP
jgi:hypothetical protein